MAYEQTFKNIDNILHTDEGCGSAECGQDGFYHHGLS